MPDQPSDRAVRVVRHAVDDIRVDAFQHLTCALDGPLGRVDEDLASVHGVPSFGCFPSLTHAWLTGFNRRSGGDRAQLVLPAEVLRRPVVVRVKLTTAKGLASRVVRPVRTVPR